MPRPIEWIYDAADFVVDQTYDDGGRKVNRPNTQIVAIAVTVNRLFGTAVTYREMHARLTADFREWIMKPGRTSEKQRFFRERLKDGLSVSLNSYRMPKAFYVAWIEKNLPELVWIPTNFIGAKIKLHLDEGAFETDKVVLARLSGDELVPVIKGVARYPFDPNQNLDPHASRMVYGYWTTP